MQRILLCIALALGSCAAPPNTSLEKLLVSRHASKVSAPWSIGSAFPITSDSFLTAWHVVEGERPSNITVDGWAVLEVIRLYGIDAAILVTDEHGLDPWPLAQEQPRPGQRIYKSGFGQAHHWWTEGFATEDPERVSLAVAPGDSGGPVYDRRGDVVGIVVMVGIIHGSIVPHHAWIVPVSKLRDSLPPGWLNEPLGQQVPALPAPETPWDAFLRRKEELGV